MHVLHVIASLDPAGGGPPTVVLRLAAAQAALGHQVTLASHRAVGADERVRSSMADVPGIEQVKLAFLPPPGRLWLPRAAGGQLRELVRSADILQLHGMWEPLLPAAAGVALRESKPFVATPHGMLYPWSLARKSLKKKIALALGYRRLIDRAACVCALNADEKEALQLLRPRSPIDIIPNGMFIGEVDSAPADEGFRSSVPQLGDRPFVLFLSRLHPGKGLHHLAAAFKLLASAMPQVHLVVAGPDFGARQSFESQVAEAGLADRVHIVGPIYGAQKAAALSEAACFCLPSEHETFSMAILEALAFRLPVVIARSCHFPEVKEAQAGHVVELDARPIADALRDVLANPDKAREMGRAGRQLVESRYTWPAVARQSIAVYERAMSPRAAAHAPTM